MWIAPIQTLSTRGEGIARVDGKAVFIPFTLPGETWEAETVESHKQYDRGLPIRMVARADPPVVERVEPRCSYFGRCGGCHLQHATYPDQLRLKQQWLAETFRRIAHLELIPPPVTASPPWEYRNKLTIPLIEREGQIVYAFHQVYLPSQFVPIKDCWIAHPRIRKALTPVLAAINRGKPALVVPTPDRPRGSRVIFRVIGEKIAAQIQDTNFSISTEKMLSDALSPDSGVLDELILSRDQKERDPHRIGSEWEESEWDAEAGVFMQVNDVVRNALYEYILRLPFLQEEKMLDGYCGVGLLTRRLANHFRQVVGVEADSAAASDARREVSREGLENRVRIFRQTMERFLRASRERFDAVILNPPRSGLSKEVRSRIGSLQPPELVMISCHPAALARDTVFFVENGYRVVALQPFDMFPQTYHLETVVYLQNKDA